MCLRDRRNILKYCPDAEIDQKILNIFQAYFVHDDKPVKELSVQLMKDINGELAFGIWENAGEIRRQSLPVMDGVIMPTISVYTMQEDLSVLSSASEDIYRAVSYFCYIIDKFPFYQCNIETAFVCMDRVLISAGFKFVANDEEISQLLDMITDSWKTIDTSKIHEHICKNLIQKEQ